jgi:hypothetical protein
MKMSAKNKMHEMGEGKKARMNEYGSAMGGMKKKTAKKAAKKVAKKMVMKKMGKK